MNNNKNNKKNDDYYYPVKEQAEIIEKTLDSYGIKARVVEIDKLPDKSTLHKIQITVGTVIEDIEKRKRELALALGSSTGKIEIQAPIPGRSLIGIHIPKVNKSIKSNKEKEIEQGPKTILGKIVNFIANVFGITAAVLYLAVDRIEERDLIVRQFLVIIIVPVIITIIGGSFDILKILDYFIVLFITWIILLGISQKEKEK